MENNILKINFIDCSGSASIDLKEFLPATAGNMKKLIDLFIMCDQDPDQAVIYVHDFIQGRVNKLLKDREKIGPFDIKNLSAVNAEIKKYINNNNAMIKAGLNIDVITDQLAEIKLIKTSAVYAMQGNTAEGAKIQIYEGYTFCKSDLCFDVYKDKKTDMYIVLLHDTGSSVVSVSNKKEIIERITPDIIDSLKKDPGKIDQAKKRFFDCMLKSGIIQGPIKQDPIYKFYPDRVEYCSMSAPAEYTIINDLIVCTALVSTKKDGSSRYKVIEIPITDKLHYAAAAAAAQAYYSKLENKAADPETAATADNAENNILSDNTVNQDPDPELVKPETKIIKVGRVELLQCEYDDFMNEGKIYILTGYKIYKLIGNYKSELVYKSVSRLSDPGRFYKYTKSEYNYYFPAPETEKTSAPENMQPAPVIQAGQVVQAIQPAENNAQNTTKNEFLNNTVQNTAENDKAQKNATAGPEKTFVNTTIAGLGYKIYFDGQQQRTRVILENNNTALIQAIQAAGFYYSKVMQSYNKKLTFKAYRAALALKNQLDAITAAG